MLIINTRQGCKKLTDDCLLSDCSSDSTSAQLHLVLRLGMRILIKTLTGLTIILEAQPTDTIAHLKSMIDNKEGIPANRQRLFFGKKQLEDQQTLRNYDIQNKFLLQLALRVRGKLSDTKVLIFVKTLTGKIISLELETSNSIENL